MNDSTPPLDPVDLGPLDPTRDEPAFDARIRAIVGDAAIRPRQSTIAQLSAWLAPTLLAASLIIAVGSVAFVRLGDTRPKSIVESLGIPRTVIELARSNTPPGIVELSEALGAERSHVR